MTAAQRAAAFLAGELELDFASVKGLIEELGAEGDYGKLDPLLIGAARRAIYRDWERAHQRALADLLIDHQRFGYARRLFARLRAEADSEELRQRHSFCTYKDLELPARRRLDRALQILAEGERPLRESDDPETLGIAGAIYKRRWEVEAKLADLESSRWFYERGYRAGGPRRAAYPGVNAAFVIDRLAELEERAVGESERVAELRGEADRVREEIAAEAPGGKGGWDDATRAEALFGLRRVDEACEHLERVRRDGPAGWRLETTSMQIAELARIRGIPPAELARALGALLGDGKGALVRGSEGKVGLALSGGGFRASLFHIGVLARLAESGVLGRVEVLSCVSGGSILGAFYYLKLRRLLQSKPDGELSADDYVELVAELAEEFTAGVRENLRGHLTSGVGENWKMLSSSRYSRSDRLAGLLERAFYSRVEKEPGDGAGPWRMGDLFVTPPDSDGGFSLRYDNWTREAKVPILVINATTLNTGHVWQFTASWMGEPPLGSEERVDAGRRLRRVYYRDAPGEHGNTSLATAVAASAAVPGLFPPISLSGLYGEDGPIDVELADGGVHDNQGIASLVEQDCTLLLVSDASGQARDDEHPARGIVGVAKRANSVLMGRVRAAQLEDLANRRRSELVRGLMVVHLKKGLPADPRDWIDCQEPYRLEEDVLPPGHGGQRPGYGIDEKVQRALAELRTDLDVFSREEAHALMAAGYAMSRWELAQSIPGLDAEPGAERRWAFTPMLDRLAGSDDLAAELRVGHARFLRGPQRWWQRRARRPKGALRRALDRTGLPAVPGALRRGAAGLVVSPLRKLASAPLAVAGAGVTRLWLRLSRSGKGS